MTPGYLHPDDPLTVARHREPIHPVRWRIVTATFAFLIAALPTLYVVGNARSQQAACHAVAQSNRELVRFLRENAEPESQELISALARRFDAVEKTCLD